MTNDMETKIRHLEMIQGVITRMSSNSFLLKGWAITVMAGVLVLTGSRESCCFLVCLLIILFWLLDSMYLQFERQFKVLYKSIVDDKYTGPVFEISRPRPKWDEHTQYVQALYSRSEMLFYITLLLCNATCQFVAE